MTFAILPAGGRSERMGRPKLLLPFGTGTVLGAVVAAFRQAGVEQILVVVNPNVEGLAAAATAAGATPLLLPAPTPDMRATLLIGLQWAEAAWQPKSDTLWFLAPADHPTLSSDLISTLLSAAARDSLACVFLPTWQGQRGHPALLRWREVESLLGFDSSLGVNAYFRSIPERVREVVVDLPHGFADLDTPADYERLRIKWSLDS